MNSRSRHQRCPVCELFKSSARAVRNLKRQKLDKAAYLAKLCPYSEADKAEIRKLFGITPDGKWKPRRSSKRT